MENQAKPIDYWLEMNKFISEVFDKPIIENFMAKVTEQQIKEIKGSREKIVKGQETVKK